MTEESNFNKFQKEFSEWAFKTFEGQTTEAKLRHLKKEVDEVIENPKDIFEWSDVLLLFFNAAYKEGFTIDEILEQGCMRKFEILKEREWNEPDEEGCVHHKKPEPPKSTY